MTLEELRARLAEIVGRQEGGRRATGNLTYQYTGDPEAEHGEADDLLLDYVNDAEVRRLYEAIEKWYA